MRSSVEIYNVRTGRAREVWQTDRLVEAPNFAPDGSYLLLNGDGLLYRLPLDGGEVVQVDTGFAVNCNNDHGISPDGTEIVISDKTEFGKSSVYILPIEGGTPRLVTENQPSYWHGWSPDGRRIAYCGIRDDLFDIYTISVDGGAETRLTHGEGRNDGPDYSADGQWIYFNSSRTGLMQIWRIHPDGSGLEQVTSDNQGNWFAHPSPRNDKVLILSYDPSVFDHPRDLDVRLRLMDMDGGNLKTLFELFGGQGTINVPCWSPDGDEFAYVRYFPVNS
ncbi:PD40 domain-containing protein [Rhizobium lentis]|uniref:Tol biopolymer transport system component n=1 Tax=Rhizobium lentis TaxID=1138194 RepID=A0A7W8XC27_9HYPH|nr:PD40 domain-containing protein [Rhizobium lentis]MBB4572839.1 Tol biopolymer transport system component [Rhizobium lentis]MBB5547972.1 Tol biopolymer transport system component [Rhizobium lentis]MBB5558499.1 Tol biopolymer transport system component [Rhizobium lentis]MBB5565977.1 Tol biopolymer transport system component [Rhizobium lentis]